MPMDDAVKLPDLATLTGALENVLRKLVRLLVGRISLVKLREMIDLVYVEEAEKKLKLELPGKNVPLTKLALLTGLDTRTVVAIKKLIEQNDQQYRRQFIRELTPEAAVVDVWARSIEKLSGKEKKMASQLTYGDDQSGFEQLFRSVISSRGITSQSVIERLLATKSITLNKPKKTVTLVVKQFSPYLTDDEPSILNSAFSAFSNLFATAEHNLASSGKDKWYQRQFWTFRLRPQDREEFRSAMKKFLESTEVSARKKIVPWEAKSDSDQLLSAGLGFYYFEDSTDVS